MNTDMLILRGVPASGKSTFAQGPPGWHNFAVVNRDSIRNAMYGRYWGGAINEDVVTDVENAMIDGALHKGQHVIVDATNLRNKAVQEKLSLASGHGARVIFKDFPISLEEALYRDEGRGEDGGRSVGEKVIRDFFKRYKVNPETGALKPPPELWPEFEPYVGHRAGLPSAYIVDTDGTVAEAEGVRGWFDTTKYHLDKPIVHTGDVVRGLVSQAFHIIGLSGRDAEFRDVTTKWWSDNNLHFDQFHFRPHDDRRNDAIIKYELFKNNIEPHYNVLAAIDDRPRVLRMWRKIGIPTLMVGDGREF